MAVPDTKQIPPCSKCSNRSKLFCGITILDKEYLSEDKKTLRFKRKEIIFHEGSQAHGLYCIYKGNVKLIKRGVDGKELIVDFAHKGDALGHRAMMSDTTYSATAIAMEDCEICYIAKKPFITKFNENRQLGINVIRLLSQSLEDSQNQIIGFTNAPQKERIAKALLLLKSKFGVENDNNTLNINITRREIGDIAGLTTESTIRTLSELKKENVIELIQKKIKITDIKKLSALARIDYATSVKL